MFRHKGKGRTYSHNLKLASLLSGVAGIVNITGVLSLNTLTTNVTGHFAFFSEQFFLKNYAMSFTFLLYTLFFLLGAFVTSTLMELAPKNRPHTYYTIPMSAEISILLIVGCSGLFNLYNLSPIWLSCLLLFAMGLQNALVTRISKSVVRTTHLTGLFTDLGIELSQLFFYKGILERKKLNKNIYLKIAIIGCFFLGGFIGGLVHLKLGIKTLFLPVGLLFFTLWYDRLLFRYYTLKRKFRTVERTQI